MKIPRDAPRRKVIKALERLVSKLEELDLRTFVLSTSIREYQLKRFIYGIFCINLIMSITALVLGDLHFPYEYRFYQFKRLLRDTNPDLILFCGDIINVGKKELLEKFLEETHKVSDAKIIAVMGNHDFWLPRDTYIPPSRTSWYNILIFQRVFKKFGDILLWKDPFIFEDIGFVGVPGWFDFTFAPWHLGFKLMDFMYGFYDNMIWNDTQFVDFRMSPMKATKIHIHMLKRQLDKIVSEGLKKSLFYYILYP